MPYFNGQIYLQNKTHIGKVEEIFGQITSAFFTIKMQEGINANSYSEGDAFFIDPSKLLPLERFLPQPKGSKGAGAGRGGGRGGGRMGGRMGGRGRGFGGRSPGFGGRSPGFGGRSPGRGGRSGFAARGRGRGRGR